MDEQKEPIVKVVKLNKDGTPRKIRTDGGGRPRSPNTIPRVKGEGRFRAPEGYKRWKVKTGRLKQRRFNKHPNQHRVTQFFEELAIHGGYMTPKQAEKFYYGFLKMMTMYMRTERVFYAPKLGKFYLYIFANNRWWKGMDGKMHWLKPMAIPKFSAGGELKAYFKKLEVDPADMPVRKDGKPLGTPEDRFNPPPPPPNA